MDYETIVFLVIMGLISLAGLIAFACSQWWEYQHKKFIKNHPEFIELQNATIAKGNANWEWRNLIDQKKKAIDEVLAEMPYLTAREREKVEKQIDVWRVELFLIREDARPHFEEHILLREKFEKMKKELMDKGELKYY